MRKTLLLASALLAAPLWAEEPVKPAPSPGEIVAAAPAKDWTAIVPSDLLVMDLALGANGKPRRVVIQLMPPPFSQGWIGNIRTLARAHWWDGLSVNRVQDNYVVQWGDADGEDKAKARALPAGLAVVPESDYVTPVPDPYKAMPKPAFAGLNGRGHDAYSRTNYFKNGWPIALDFYNDVPLVDAKTGKPIPPRTVQDAWPVHCYGMVGVGRDLSPNTGTGAELYTVIGHAPRHLDRNIALVGRVIEGIEHLSSLPRGTGTLGFYETPEERTTIASVRLASEMEVDPVPRYEYLSTESASFATYADARANRRDPFFIRPAEGADICNIPVPVRRHPAPK